MIESLYLSQVDEPISRAEQVITKEFIQSGLIHSKIAGRFEVVKTLPKKAETIDDMFNYADAYGKIKFATINSAHKISNVPNKEEKSATVFGGELGIKSAEYNGISINILTYVSQKINFLNPSKAELNEDFFDYDGDSIAYVAESSLDYNSDSFNFKVGRLRVETPYANSDDIRMAPNTFEGAWSSFDYTSKLQTQIIYFNRWAGYDSQDEQSQLSQNEFKNLVDEDSFGMFGASLTYEYAKNSELSFWYNYIDNMSAIAYAEIVGIYFIDDKYFHIDYGFQATNISELDNSGIGGDVFGAMTILHYNGFFFGTSYNFVLADEGNSITNGFGGGPYYTSLDEATITAISEAAPGENAEAFRIGSGYEFENGLVTEVVYGELSNAHGRIVEADIVLGYEINDKLNLAATYTKYNSSCNNNTFDRSLVRIEYSF